MNPISNSLSLPVSAAGNTERTSPFEAQKSFSSWLKDSIEQVNKTQIESDQMTQKLIKGEDVELHEVMIAASKASVTLQATIEVRNKVVEAYKEVMRMQL
ncbi:MAG TPA: flagellar hook-basal body complex protein FliE [Bacillus sp. (in: firmicutes)]|nr:flagellar hook-basal body complex protein FliE [Bacillus litorisediminis]HWO77951.1 flagellar hook-basal body complex protein FliE [Bacillus sp. (in: firmicutes)]